MNNIIAMPMIIPLLTGIFLIFLRRFVKVQRIVSHSIHLGYLRGRYLHIEPYTNRRHFTTRLRWLVAAIWHFVCRGFIFHAARRDDSACNRNYTALCVFVDWESA